ncbi:hypothetical protein U9M48_035725 [Paspalum notatum var. saurae]|uniref:Uncharacterized protein n=1 Tax=Paspalum notatum var. saurae TaxID=547442 RepID=A0AAQ3UFQ0_PASNO
MNAAMATRVQAHVPGASGPLPPRHPRNHARAALLHHPRYSSAPLAPPVPRPTCAVTMLAMDDPLRATPAPPLHHHRVPLALVQLWIPTKVPPTSILARIGSPRRRHTDAAVPRFTAAAPPLRSSPHAEIWGKSFPIDGNTVRHRLGSKSGSQAAGAARRPLPCVRPKEEEEKGRRRRRFAKRPLYVIKNQVRGTTSSNGGPEEQLSPKHDLECPSVVFGRRSCPRDQGVAWAKPHNSAN